MTADEYDVLTSAILIDILGDSSSTGAVVMLNDRTHVAGVYSGEKGYKRLCYKLRAVGRLSCYSKDPFIKECIEDFLAKNKQSWDVVVPQGRINDSIKVMPREEIDKTFLGVESVGSSWSWDNFKKNNPGIQAVALVSRVGFSTDGKWALVYLKIAEGRLSGSAQFVMLKKVEDHWEIAPEFFFLEKVVA